MKRLKICFTGNVFPVSKSMAYGGERILLYLIEELAKRHDIYVFMREGSDFSGIPIKDYVPVGPLVNERDVHFEAAKAYGDFDLYQANYFGEGWGPEVLEKYNYVELTWCAWSHIGHQLNRKPFNTISYSNSLKQDFDNLGHPTIMIHYGIPKNLYQFVPEKENYICWIGKMEGGKAPGMAAKIAKAAGMKLVIMAPPYNTNVLWQEVVPHVDNKTVFWVRGVDDAMKFKIMSKAKCLLYTCDNSWREHLGIVFLEALAMGTPIVGMNRMGHENSLVLDGIIEDGKHGFLLNHQDSNDPEEVVPMGVDLLNRVHEINPADCREQFEKRFTAELMARRYEYLYNMVAGGGRFGELEIPF